MSPQSADVIWTYSDVAFGVGDGLGDGVGVGDGVGLGDGEGLGTAAGDGDWFAVAFPPNGLQAAKSRIGSAPISHDGRMGASLATGP
jgi:hypothetical protein